MTHSTRATTALKWILAIAVFLLAGCSLNSLFGGTSRDYGPSAVEVAAVHQACDTADDCVLVYTDCSTCDCGTPVNRAHEELYLELYLETCRDYTGPVCEMYCPEAALLCLEGQCKIDN